MFAGADFRAFNSHGAKSVGGVSNNGMPPNGIAWNGDPFKAQNFSPSQFVGPAQQFKTHVNLGSRGTVAGKPISPGLQPGDSGYIGLRFTIGSDIHYGWANLSVGDNFTVILNTLGYETVPDTAAHVEGSVPDGGSTLALLTLGATGLLAFRLQQRKAA
jgi:hypothetical protein